MAKPLPCPVYVRLVPAQGTAHDARPEVGLLLEWRQVAGKHQGLVVWAGHVDALSSEWEVRMRWLETGQFWAANV